MDPWWVRCGHCFAFTSPLTSTFICLTSCGHFVCNHCLSKSPLPQPSSTGYCYDCKKPCSVVNLAQTDKLSPDVAFYFKDPSVLFQKMIDIENFQRLHRNRCMENTLKKHLIEDIIKVRLYRERSEKYMPYFGQVCSALCNKYGIKPSRDCVEYSPAQVEAFVQELKAFQRKQEQMTSPGGVASMMEVGGRTPTHFNPHVTPTMPGYMSSPAGSASGISVGRGSNLRSTNPLFRAHGESISQNRDRNTPSTGQQMNSIVHHGRITPTNQLHHGGRITPTNQLHHGGRITPTNQLHHGGRITPTNQLNSVQHGSRITPTNTIHSQMNSVRRITPTNQMNPVHYGGRITPTNSQMNSARITPNSGPQLKSSNLSAQGGGDRTSSAQNGGGRTSSTQNGGGRTSSAQGGGGRTTPTTGNTKPSPLLSSSRAIAQSQQVSIRPPLFRANAGGQLSNCTPPSNMLTRQSMQGSVPVGQRSRVVPMGMGPRALLTPMASGGTPMETGSRVMPIGRVARPLLTPMVSGPRLSSLPPPPPPPPPSSSAATTTSSVPLAPPLRCEY